MALKLILISFIICYIIDVSGFVNNLKMYISKLLTGRKTSDYSLKPFDCSTCMNFWVILAYMICNIIKTNSFPDTLIISFSVACLFSLMAEQITSFIWLLKEITGKIINKAIKFTER